LGAARLEAAQSLMRREPKKEQDDARFGAAETGRPRLCAGRFAGLCTSHRQERQSQPERPQPPDAQPFAAAESLAATGGMSRYREHLWLATRQKTISECLTKTETLKLHTTQGGE